MPSNYKTIKCKFYPRGMDLQRQVNVSWVQTAHSSTITLKEGLNPNFMVIIIGFKCKVITIPFKIQFNLFKHMIASTTSQKRNKNSLKMETMLRIVVMVKKRRKNDFFNFYFWNLVVKRSSNLKLFLLLISFNLSSHRLFFHHFQFILFVIDSLYSFQTYQQLLSITFI